MPESPQSILRPQQGAEVQTVSEICAALNELVAEFPVLSVKGEVQNLHVSKPGHKYFDIVEGGSTLKVKMWSSRAGQFQFSNGDEIIIEGGFDFYAARGEISLIANSLVQAGEGAVLAKIEATRARLDADGLFAEGRKRPIPALPRAIGVVCGKDAAVRKDIEAARSARFPGYPIVWCEALVTGKAAVPSILTALHSLEGNRDVEVILIARGGGSFDDLIPFSDEELCRSIASSRCPVVSAVGHEGDSPLCDHVADLRCSTPTRAGHMVIPSKDELAATADQALDSISRSLGIAFDRVRSAVATLGARLDLQSPERRIMLVRETLLRLSPTQAIEKRLALAGERIAGRLASLIALSPQSTLDRGYAVVQNRRGVVLAATTDAPAGTELLIRMARGKITAISKGGETNDTE